MKIWVISFYDDNFRELCKSRAFYTEYGAMQHIKWLLEHDDNFKCNMRFRIDEVEIEVEN